MACFLTSLGEILFFGILSFTAANDNTCQIYAAVGKSATLTFNYEGLTKSHFLRWTHNKTIIFNREQGKVITGKPEDITTTGSYLLKSVNLKSAGDYSAVALHPNKTLAKTWTGQLCVTEKVSKPRLTHVCETDAVKLECTVAEPQGLVYSWSLDKKILPNETKKNLSLSLSQLKKGSSISCTVANEVSAESSETLQPACKTPTLCFETKTVLGVLAGGTGLILLLFIIITVLCCAYRRTKTKMQLSGKGEYTMLSVNNREAKSTADYENLHSVESYQSPSPQPSPRACYQNISRLDVETESSTPQVSTAAEGQRPSPVPKPRTVMPKH